MSFLSYASCTLHSLSLRSSELLGRWGMRAQGTPHEEEDAPAEESGVADAGEAEEEDGGGSGEEDEGEGAEPERRLGLVERMEGGGLGDLSDVEVEMGHAWDRRRVGTGGGGRSMGLGCAPGEVLVYDSTFRSCVVCLEEYVEGQCLRLLPCAHAFHVRCAEMWLRVESRCPVCLKPVAMNVGVAGGANGAEWRGVRERRERDRRNVRWGSGVDLIDYSVHMGWGEWFRRFISMDANAWEQLE